MSLYFILNLDIYREYIYDLLYILYAHRFISFRLVGIHILFAFYLNLYNLRYTTYNIYTFLLVIFFSSPSFVVI